MRSLILKIDFYNRTKKSISDNIFLSVLPAAKRALIREKKIQRGKHFKIELTLVGNTAISKLNKQYLGRRGITDVISLSYFKKNMKDIFAGEIFISVPFANRQAKKFDHSLMEELQVLFIHALLHIFGFDHNTKTAEAKMNRLTSVIMEQEAARFETGLKRRQEQS